MDTCHYCHEVVEKLNQEYESLYAENEKNKQKIESMREEMELIITEQLCKVKWFRDNKEDIPIEMGLKLLVKQANSQEEDIKDMCKEMEQLEEENTNLETEHEQTCQELRDQVDIEFALERKNDKLKQTVAGLRWRQLTLAIASS